MFKFLKSLKPGGKPTKSGTTSKPLGKPLPKGGIKPSNPMTPLSNGAPPSAKAPPTEPAQFTPTGFNGERPMTPERAKLIKDALSVHRAQQNVFAELNDEARHKLVLMAMLTLLKEARGEK